MVCEALQLFLPDIIATALPCGCPQVASSPWRAAPTCQWLAYLPSPALLPFLHRPGYATVCLRLTTETALTIIIALLRMIWTSQNANFGFVIHASDFKICDTLTLLFCKAAFKRLP